MKEKPSDTTEVKGRQSQHCTMLWFPRVLVAFPGSAVFKLLSMKTTEAGTAPAWAEKQLWNKMNQSARRVSHPVVAAGGPDLGGHNFTRSGFLRLQGKA